MCAFGVCLSYRVTWTWTSIASESSRANENGTSTSRQTARVPGPKISTSCATLTAAHDNLAPSTLTLTWTVIPTWTKTSILNLCLYACVLCSCGRGMPCVRRLHLGDTSPCVSADCGGGTGTAGVLAHARLLDGLKTFSRLVGLWKCEAGGREPCSSLERAKKDSVGRQEPLWTCHVACTVTPLLLSHASCTDKLFVYTTHPRVHGVNTPSGCRRKARSLRSRIISTTWQPNKSTDEPLGSTSKATGSY